MIAQLINTSTTMTIVSIVKLVYLLLALLQAQDHFRMHLHQHRLVLAPPLSSRLFHHHHFVIIITTTIITATAMILIIMMPTQQHQQLQKHSRKWASLANVPIQSPMVLRRRAYSDQNPHHNS